MFVCPQSVIRAFDVFFITAYSLFPNKNVTFADFFIRHTLNKTIKMKEELEARVERAVDYFMQGYGCCQSVVAAFADI